jgi:DNA-binding IclR family transcriptional regulator
MSDFASDLVAQERAARVTWALAEGARMTTREVAECTGLHLRSAYHMMNKLARVLPITLDDCGHWVRADALVHRVREYVAK